MGRTSVINVKVPEELKKQMKRSRSTGANISRQCVQKKIAEQKMNSASAKLDDIL